MMRLLLLAGVTAAALSGPARAQMPVVDNASLVQLYKEVQQGTQSLGYLSESLTQLQGQLRAVTGLVNVNGMAQQLMQPLTQNPLGGLGIENLQNIVGGSTAAGFPGANYASTFANQERVYQPQGQDFMATLMNQRFGSLTNIQGIAMQMFQSTQQRIVHLPDLQSELAAAPDLQTVSAINGRIAMEQANVTTQQQQAGQLLALAQLQSQVDDQRVLQKQRADYEALQAVTANELTDGWTTTAPTMTGRPAIAAAVPVFGQ